MAEQAGRHWAVIETGSNQAYIFASNKQILNVGSSHLVRLVGEQWAPEIVREVDPSAQVVLASSGKTLILASKPTCEEVIRRLTEKALLDAPGLTVWGAISRSPIGESGDDWADLLSQTYLDHAALRPSLPSADVRFPLLPFLQPDSFSGKPATIRKNEMLRSATVDAQWRAGAQARDWMATQLAKHGEPEAVTRALISRRSLSDGDGITNNGWVAVVHADGNGIGRLFFDLGHAFEGEEFVSAHSDLSAGLGLITWGALADAVAAVQSRHEKLSEWLLPLVVGGDDLTVLVNGSVAYEFTVEYIRALEIRASQHERLVEILSIVASSQDTPPIHLTASAGIAAVGPHHPFSHAYELAEELTRSAKTMKERTTQSSALDVHVLFESSLRSLESIRAALHIGELDAWAGPLSFSNESDDLRSLNKLDQLIAALRPAGDRSKPLLRWGAAHELRAGLLEGDDALRMARIRVENAQRLAAMNSSAPADSVGKLGAVLDEHLVVEDSDGTSFSRLVTAIDLVDLAQGTVASR